ncbi:secreted Ly-6/uPAR domain-containing protein 2 [Nycticebus coucang]|uniref:secreted Ly-6/uPAR domain-containing protein 2 n=1 Tax=Nycticebus coucang TaxID=9470 RepID=UPI00234DB3CA|nr:secreted Ly-6/uPAR domain-containing protein 2 [Nycticebus coucang]
MQFHAGSLLAVLLSLQLASAQAMWCHQCKGFGGCSHKSRCPEDSTHCVTIATRDLISFNDLPLVTKRCQRGCPDIQSLGLGPHVSIACCQASLCNQD